MKLRLSLGCLSLLCFQARALPAQAAHPLQATQGLVASDHAQASQAGIEILRQGGNAVDAAIATSLALSVLRNQSTGLGGGGFMLIRPAQGAALIIDSRETAPAAASERMFLNATGSVIPELSTTGWKAAAIPGLLAGLEQASRRYGKLPWKALFQPAIRLAEGGFVVDAHYAEASLSAQKRNPDVEFQRTFFCQGRPCRIGERVHLPALAKTLRHLSDKGIQSFYRGELAAQIADAAQRHGGLISRMDLANYKARLRAPLVGSYRGLQVLTMPPPSSGGTALLQMLNLLELQAKPQRPGEFGSATYLHTLAEVMKHAFADRAEYLGDPDFVSVPVGELTSKSLALRLQARLAQARQQTLPREAYGKRGLSFSSLQAPVEDQGTTHYVVMDRWGNLVSSTETINTYFGSLVVVPGTGLLLNNEMDDFSRAPGSPNAFGLIGNLANAIAPGKKPLSSMTPTLVLRQGRPYLALGASGGPRIITATLQTLLNVVDFDMNIADAVAAPRIHHQWVPDKLYVEKWMPQEVREALMARGHSLETGQAESTVQALMVDSGRILGSSDPRKGGAPAGY